MNATLLEKKQESIRRLADILRDTPTPMSSNDLCSILGLSRSTVWRYCNILKNELGENETLECTTSNYGSICYRIVNTGAGNEGYWDPTADAAMESVSKKENTNPWKYAVGDIWHVTTKHGELIPFMIVSIFADSAMVLRVYEEWESNKVDLNNPHIYKDGKYMIDSSQPCTKKYSWMYERIGSIQRGVVDDIRAHLTRIIGSTDEDTIKKLEEELGEAMQEIHDREKVEEELRTTIKKLEDELVETRGDLQQKELYQKKLEHDIQELNSTIQRLTDEKEAADRDVIHYQNCYAELSLRYEELEKIAAGNSAITSQLDEVSDVVHSDMYAYLLGENKAYKEMMGILAKALTC